jgi:hypothetical protein
MLTQTEHAVERHPRVISVDEFEMEVTLLIVAFFSIAGRQLPTVTG